MNRLSLEVFRRDRSICADCGCDCEKIMRVYWAILNFEAQLFYAETLWLGEEKRYWQVDHVIERADGGSDVLTNLQTLCVPCHHAKTVKSREERQRRYARVRASKNQTFKPLGPVLVVEPVESADDYTARVDAVKDWVNAYLQRTWDANGTGRPKTLEPIESDYLADPMIYH